MSVCHNTCGLLYMMKSKSTAEAPHSNASSTYPKLQTTVESFGRHFLQAKVTFGRLKFAKPFFAKAVTIKALRPTHETWDVSSNISQIHFRMCSCLCPATPAPTKSKYITPLIGAITRPWTGNIGPFVTTIGAHEGKHENASWSRSQL